MIQDSKELYDFITGINDRVIEKFKTINKSVRRAKLWHGVVEEDAEVQDFRVTRASQGADRRSRTSVWSRFRD